MPDDPRTYLLERFATDSATLRARVAQLAGHPAPEHGPNADTSALMADACDRVVELLQAIPAKLERAAMRSALRDLGPVLHGHAERTIDPFQKSVYTGAATRVNEIVKRDADADDEGADDAADDEDAEDADFGDTDTDET